MFPAPLWIYAMKESRKCLRQIGVQLCTSHISNEVSNECCCLFYIIFLIFKVSKKKQHLLAFGYGSTTLCILCSAAITPTIVHQTSLKQILNMASKKFQQNHFLSRRTPKFNTLFLKKMQDVSINTFCWLISPGSSVPGVPVCPVERAGKHKTRTEPMIIGERLCLQRASRNLWWPPIFHRWDCENKIRQPYGVTWEWAKCSEMSWVSDQRWSVVTVENE